MGIPAQSSNCLHRFVRGLSLLSRGHVNKSLPPPLAKKQRQQDFPPILNSSVDSADLQAIVGVVDPQSLSATAAPQHILRTLLTRARQMSDPNLGLTEAHGVVNAIGAFEELHFVQSITFCCEQQVDRPSAPARWKEGTKPSREKILCPLIRAYSLISFCKPILCFGRGGREREIMIKRERKAENISEAKWCVRAFLLPFSARAARQTANGKKMFGAWTQGDTHASLAPGLWSGVLTGRELRSRGTGRKARPETN